MQRYDNFPTISKLYEKTCLLNEKSLDDFHKKSSKAFLFKGIACFIRDE
jgi:hypothetical protein